MTIYLSIFLFINTFTTMVIFDFDAESDLSNWYIVDDVVMGGRSDGSFNINNDGHGQFSGRVSLENNGGFSSVRHDFDKLQLNQKYTTALLKVKGDGKQYQFRVKADQSQRHSYIYNFKTTGDWETISIPLAEMAPYFRGRALRIPNFSAEELSEIAILISNKVAEEFTLEIDWIKFSN